MMKQPQHSRNILTLIRVAKIRLERIWTEKPLIMAVLVTAVTFILYLGTLIPEVGWGDSAELALSAYQLGVTHPPGYPLHTILGKLVSLFFTDPAIGTNLLSAICSSLAAGVMSLLIHELTALPIVAILTSILFSVLPNIWEMAVVTEVYNVNIFLLGCSIYLFLRAQQSRFTKFLIPSAILFGLSLGTYQANLLLAPAFFLLIWIRSPQDRVFTRLLEFFSIVGFIWLVLLAYSVLRSRTQLAINYPLNSFEDIFAYATGSGLRPPYPKDIAFYIDRTIMHTSLFLKNFLYLPIPIGLLGAFALFRQDRNAAIFLGITFGINFLFFGYYPVSDYLTMLTPSYFIFAIWIGCGIATFFPKTSHGREIVKFVGVGLCALLIGVQLVNQLPNRFERSNTRPVSELILPALSAFPKDAIVISRWERYAPLLYFQQVRNIREDITLVVSNEFLDQIDLYSLQSSDRPILIDNNDTMLGEKYQIKRYHRRWFLIIAPLEE